MATIFDRFRSKYIAAFYTESPYNKMEYVGKTIFPAKQNPSLELAWLKGAGGLPVELKNSQFGAKATIRDRIGFSDMRMEMPFFREAMQIGEKERMQLMNFYASPESPLAMGYVNKIYDDQGQLLVSADVTAEKMAMQLLSTGLVGIENNGVPYNYDYKFPATQKETLAGGDLWTDASADVIGQITEWQDKVEETTGERPNRAICHKNTFKLLRANTGIKLLAYKGEDPTKITLVDADVVKVLDSVLSLTVIINSKKYKNQSGVATNYFPENVFTLLPSGNVGNMYYAPTPEKIDKAVLGAAGYDVTELNNVTVTSIVHPHPVNRETIVSAVMLPSGENLEKCFIATVAA